MNKFGARRTAYGGRTYDSKLEATCAKVLDTLRHANNPADRVVWVAEQIPFTFPWGTVHRIDFIVGKADGSVCFIECKGYDTRLGQEKRKALEYYLGHQVTVWKGGS